MSKKFVESQYLGPSFKENILPYLTDTKYEGEITTNDLTRSLTDEEIVKEYGIEEIPVESLASYLEKYLMDADKSKTHICYTKTPVGSHVVRVVWGDGGWVVGGWGRGRGWDAGGRVFAPATGTGSVSTVNSETKTLEESIKIVKDAGYKVIREF